MNVHSSRSNSSALVLAAALLLGSANAQGAMIYSATFSAVIDQIDATVPGLQIGSVVTGSFTFDMEQAVSPTRSEMSDFQLRFAGRDFTNTDVWWSHVSFNTAAQTISSVAQLGGGEGLEDFAYEFSLTLAHIEGAPHLWLYNNDVLGEIHTSRSASGPAHLALHALEVPAPASLLLMLTALGVVSIFPRSSALCRK